MNKNGILELEQIIAKGCPNMAGMVVRKDGETRYEKYFNDFHASDTLHVFSVTKSIVSILLGIAMDKGFIKSLDQKVLDFFPDYIPKRGEKTLPLITLRDMITMTAPLKYKSAPYTRYFTSENWVKTALDLLGGKGEIGTFRYAPLIGPDILSGIIQSATGKPALAFANENLFAPLGIAPRQGFQFESKESQMAWYKLKVHTGEWITDPQGVCTAGWGLTLTTGEMAKIGQLCLDRGIWEGGQVVSSRWVDDSTREHSRWDEIDLAYGYLWWVVDQEARCFAAVGDGGNVIYVNGSKNLTVSMTSIFQPRIIDRLDFIKQYVEPLF